MNRRTLLKVGVVAPVVLAAGGALLYLGADAARDRTMVVRALVPALLDGALPAGGAPRTARIDATVDAVAAAIAGLPLATQTELGQAFAVLATRVGRIAAGGPFADWSEADTGAVGRMLQGWRMHPLDAVQALYQAMHDLVLTSYYADEARWPEIGYPGPLAL